MVKSAILNISTELQIELALDVKASETEELLLQYLNDNIPSVITEKKINYIDRLYSSNLCLSKIS